LYGVPAPANVPLAGQGGNWGVAKLNTTENTSNRRFHYLIISEAIVNLPPDLVNFVNERLARGAYASAHEVIQTAFRLLEQRERILARIDRGTDELRRGDRYALESAEDWQRFFETLKQRGTERNQQRGAT
jgi:putative addiction module CopG family antidote